MVTKNSLTQNLHWNTVIKEADLKPKPAQEELSEQFWNWKKCNKQHFAEVCYLPTKLGGESIMEVTVGFKRNRIKQLEPVSFDFFHQDTAKGIPITGRLLKAKAIEFASSLRIEGFKASNGWLGSWKGRYNVKQYKRCGEGADFYEEVVDGYRNRIPSIILGKNETDMFNCDETGLFYHAMPDKTLAQKGDAVKGGKLAKERLTVLFCCSASGESWSH